MTEETHEDDDEVPDLFDEDAGEQPVDGEPKSTADGDGEEQETEPAGGGDRVEEYLLKGSLVVLFLLALVATMQFYSSAQTAISRLASDQFRPLFRAVFNLVVLLAAGIGIAQVVRRLG